MEIDTQATVYYKYNFTKKKLFKNDSINFFTIIKMSDTINLHDVKV